MALLSTGLIRNNEGIEGRRSSTLSLRIVNNDLVSVSIQIRGFHIKGTTKTEYVLDVVLLAPGGVENRNYYAQFEAFEFLFTTTSDAVEISAWGQHAGGDLSEVFRVLPAELEQLGVKRTERNSESTISSFVNRTYVANSNSNSITIIDKETNAQIGIINVGLRPFGVGVNPRTNRIYVANQGSDNVSVIDGFSNTVITTIKVGISPERVDVDPTTDRIYITNVISNNISVINGSTNTVIATLTKK